jgi:hypothetical protein
MIVAKGYDDILFIVSQLFPQNRENFTKKLVGGVIIVAIFVKTP